jgi:hypothetical protein
MPIALQVQFRKTSVAIKAEISSMGWELAGTTRFTVVCLLNGLAAFALGCKKGTSRAKVGVKTVVSAAEIGS